MIPAGTVHPHHRRDGLGGRWWGCGTLPLVETFLAWGFAFNGVLALSLAVRLYRLSGVTEHLEARLANAREHRPPPEGLLSTPTVAPRDRNVSP